MYAVITKKALNPTTQIHFIPCKASTIPTERENRFVQQGRAEVAQKLYKLVSDDSAKACHDAVVWSDRMDAHPGDEFYEKAARERSSYFGGTNHCDVIMRKWCENNGLEV